MSTEEEYYINLYVGCKSIRDPYVRYLGGEMDNLRVLWNDNNTINMLNYWVKHKEIDLYIEHEIDTAIFGYDDLMLVVATVEGASDGNECVEVAGSKGGKGVEVAGNKDGEGGEGLGEKGVEVVGIKCGNGGEVEGGEGLNGKSVEIAGDKGLEEGDGGLNSSIEKVGEEGVEDESDSDSKDENVYLMKVMYFSDGDDDEELQ
ncbi:hypothetical protein PVK06_021190 [Gossypium arboreum]|uniref:Uncharacterized protein n=1 Tax=Gossypium arboreum TaxID=29729 RepID=A0ABR0PPI8_GOSAR|nr:hypothetical protein PVK06_021190 [Gossypium arboreum]